MTVERPIGDGQLSERWKLETGGHSVHRHPYFNLWLHDNEELSSLLGEFIVERVVLHEWPLSCVQRVHLASGATYIYKVQAPPTVEPNFYAAARSELLVSARILEVPGQPAALVFDDLAESQQLPLDQSEVDGAAVVEEILKHLAQISGELPAFTDIRTEERWIDFVDIMLRDLVSLVESGTFRAVDHAAIKIIATSGESPVVLEVIRSASGYVHGDLKVENVFLLRDGYRVIDWQRPFWGPVALDAASMMISLGIDPTHHISRGVLQLRRLLSIAWSVQCARRWFPDGTPDYDTAVASLARELARQ